MDIRFASTLTPGKTPLIVGVSKKCELPHELPSEIAQWLLGMLQDRSFDGETSRHVGGCAPDGRYVVAVGLGKGRGEKDARLWGGSSVAIANELRSPTVDLALPSENRSWLMNALEGMILGEWRMGDFRSNARPLPPMPCKTMHVLSKADLVSSLQETFDADHLTLAANVLWARHLVNLPPNVLTTTRFKEILEDLAPLGIAVEVLEHSDLEKLGYNALRGVAQGSVFPPYLVILQWKGDTDASRPPVAFVGKGITFDSGGLSLKPSAGMETMKGDMGGAAAVAGVLRLLASRKAPVNALGVIALAENMPSGHAQRPGDVVTSASGQTIEILNTDAEGRLILADALWHTQKLDPSCIVDLATLTGAMRIALGESFAGIFSNNDALSQAVFDAGHTTGERVWRLPLDPEYDRAIDSDIADMKNIADPGVGAGSITAAQFLQRFINKKPWIHIDIAAVGWPNKPSSICPRGGEAFGIRLLDRWIRQWNSSSF